MTQPILERLESVPVFQTVSAVELQTIAEQLQAQRWLRHQAVMPPNDTVNHYYIVLAGRVKISVQNPDSGRELIIQLLRTGDGHDVIPLLDGKPHYVQATTLDPVEAVSAPVSTWRQWLNDYPPLRRFLMNYAARRLRDISLLASDLALHDTSTRLAHLLLRHLDSAGNEYVLAGLTHEEIAQLIGTVRVVVNRLLNRFKREGLIHTTTGTLRITDIERLLEKAETQYADRLRNARQDNSTSPSNR